MLKLLLATILVILFSVTCASTHNSRTTYNHDVFKQCVKSGNAPADCIIYANHK